MRVVVVGGAGSMGRVVVQDLARSPGVDAVTVADLDAERAQAAAAQAEGVARRLSRNGPVAGLSGVEADVSSPEFPAVLRGHDVCIASVGYRLNLPIVEACLAAGCGYVDLGGLFHVARQTLEYDGRFREGGLTGVTCVGGAPGITNMLAVLGARELDSVSAVRVRLGAFDPSIEGLPLPIPYSLDTLLDEFSLPAMAYREGGFQAVEPLGEPEEVDFSPPVGPRTAVSTLHSEVATLARAYPQAEVTFKIAFEPGFTERFRLLAAIGLASSDPLDVGGQRVRPRDVLIALSRTLPQAEGVEDVDCLRVELVGERDGRATHIVAESVVGPDRNWGIGGGTLDTAVPPSIVARMIAAGETRGPGMLTPEEALDPDLFFERLGERGIRHDVRRVG
jgi:lysine 6-dehydrogenase